MIIFFANDNISPIFAENAIDMDTTRQTIIRMSESLYQRIKQNARLQQRSVNNYMVSVLEKSLPEEFPELDPADFLPDQPLRALGKTLSGATANAEQLDEKAKYILSK